MTRRRAVLVGGLLAVLVALAAFVVVWRGWEATGPLGPVTPVTVESGSTLSGVAQALEQAKVIDSARGFLLRAKLFGGREPVQAGEYEFRPGMALRQILEMLQKGEVVRNRITVPEGMPSILVYERLLAEEKLTGDLKMPAEGSILPSTYDFKRGEPRQAVLDRMQQDMKDTLAELWPRRKASTVVKTPAEAVNLAAIVEKETGKPSERRMVAGVYSNRLRIGMKLDADPTVIYPITKGKPLGRRIRLSELRRDTGYNTYVKPGLPAGPIANPGRASIEAVLDPAPTKALYFVADGTGGHVFADTLAEHNANVAKWRAIRRARGEM